MKFIGKAEQKKIDLQIEGLQQQIAQLQSQLKAKSKELESIQAEANKFKQTSVEASKHLADVRKQLADAKAQLEIAQADAVKVRQACESSMLEVKAQLDTANKALADTKASQANTAKELDAKAKELVNAKAAAAKVKQEGDAAIQAVKAEADKTKLSLDAANKELVDIKSQLDAKVKEMVAAQAAAAKAKQNSDAILSATKAQLETKSKEFEVRSKELSTVKEFSVKFKQERDLANTAFADAKVKIEVQAKELTALKTERDKLAKQAQQTEAKYQDSAQENELLLLQLMQAQEELVEYYEQKGEFEKLYQAYKARWERLEKRLPSYLDFGAIEIVDVDGVSDVPSITWQVKDFAQAGVALSEFSFTTVLQDGHPGIGLVKDGKPYAFVPKLLSTHKDQLATFLGLTTTEFKQLTAAVTILDQLEAGQWQGFEFPPQFDPSFWRPSIKTLVAQLKLLPALLRYDEVRLKRELINPDYEHLWLEFRGLSMGAAQWKKFEIRLGAALVQTDGFSQYPKFEIPLIDGKTKPFESWYAESQDDSGAKLELRFALDKNVFDVAVWSKLADADKALLLRVIYAMPEVLKRLEQQKTAIHRPWSTWVDFATAAVKVLEANKAAAKLAAEPAQEADREETKTASKATPKALPASAVQAKLPAPTKLTSTGAKAGKVISITSKPVAKSVAKPKPKAKTTVAKAAAKPVVKATTKTAAKTTRKAKA